MILGLYTKKEVINEKIKSYNSGFEDGAIFLEAAIEKLALKEEKICMLEEEKKYLEKIIKEERHDKSIRIKAIAKRTKKIRVKKKCEARLDKNALSK